MRNILIKFILFYLRIAAKVQLAKIKPKHIVGITGSAGKSSCREAVYAVLKDKFKVKQSSTGNSETGLPLDILGFDHDPNYSMWYWLKVALLIPVKLLTNWKKYDIYVAEMGVDSPYEPKNMSYLLKILKPDIGVFLNVSTVHTQYFETHTHKGELVDLIVNEKGKLITTLPKNGFALLNLDDPNVAKLANQTDATVVAFGHNSKAQLRNFSLPIPGHVLSEVYDYTLTAAVAVGKILGIDLEEAKGLLQKNFKLPPGRGTIFGGVHNSIIIDSSYNASRIPMLSALKLLKNYPGLRKIAVLGDMRELGSLAKVEHEAIATVAVKNADYIFTFGPLMNEFFFPKAVCLGFNHKKIFAFTSLPKLITTVKEFIQPNDIILVKGSQNTILLETLVEAILANRQDKPQLCRRGAFWDKKRAELLR